MRHPYASAGRRVGSQGHRSTGRGPTPSLSRNDRNICANLKYMRAFAEAWPREEFVQQVVAQLPWGHNTHLLDAIKSPAEREWYARQAIQNGWSRNVFAHQIESGLFARQGSALTNFYRTLPAEQSELAQQLIKDPYSFDFLSLTPEMQERDLERA